MLCADVVDLQKKAKTNHANCEGKKEKKKTETRAVVEPST
jgi:hypothetical protein